MCVSAQDVICPFPGFVIPTAGHAGIACECSSLQGCRTGSPHFLAIAKVVGVCHNAPLRAALEKVISQLVHSGDISNSVLHRVELLMDTQWDEDGYMIVKLTRLVKLIRQKSDRILIDFYSLLKDVCYWNSESQNVQRKWARTIFSTYTNNEKEE